jgi:hypothetical protein
MMRRLISFAAVALLTITACSGGASTAPTTAAVPSPAALQTPAATTVTVSVVDTAGPDEFLARIPAGWITVTARDVADEASLGAWRAAHPLVSQAQAKAVTDTMTSKAVSLFAFDAQNTVGGFTPNLHVTWVDAPVRDLATWLAKRATTTTKDYGLASPLEYRAWTPAGEGTVGGFIGSFRLSMSGIALAGSQLIVPMPNGRAAVLTFTCRAEQTDHFGPIVEALFSSLSADS